MHIILFPMKCLFTVVEHLKVDFNEKNDVLISYIEIHMNFDILYLKYITENSCFQKKSKLVPLNVACKSANNLKLDLMSCCYNKLFGEVISMEG